jgi:hypothetical protein
MCRLHKRIVIRIALFLHFIAYLFYSYPALSQTNSTLKIFFLGDLYFGESYQSNPKYNNGVNIIEKYGYDYMFENIKALLSESDFTIANLETPLTDSSTPKISLRKLYTHWSRPLKTVEYLKKYNINAVSLGNNHAFDCGDEGLNNTISALESGGVEFFGAGVNLKEAEKPLVKQFIYNRDTITIAVLTGFEYRKTYDSLFRFYAGDSSPGVNQISVEGTSNLIKELKSSYKNPYIIFFPHWGRNYEPKTLKQTQTAHALIDVGVDLVLGQGSHMVQEIEKYNGHWIIYSLGNSVFNAPGRYSYYGVKPYSFIAGLVIRNNPDDKEIHLRLYPIYTDNLKTNYQDRLLTSDETEDCYHTLEVKSSNKKIFKDEFRVKKSGNIIFFEIQLNR